MTSEMPMTYSSARAEEAPERKIDRQRAAVAYRRRAGTGGRPHAASPAGPAAPAPGPGFRPPAASSAIPSVQTSVSARDRASGDQSRKLDLGVRALLLALGCIKPGSARHDYPRLRSWRRARSFDAEGSAGGEKRIVADDPAACTGTPAPSHKCFPYPLQLFCAICPERCQICIGANHLAPNCRN